MWDEAQDIESIEYSDDDPAAMVAIVLTLADWQRITQEHWYRIPANRAPDRIHVTFLAFYHPRVFGEWQYSIRYLAPVHQISVVSRLELVPDEPNHPRANELYYRFDLGDLEELPRPIVSGRLRRITFIPTRLSLLLSSTEVAQLWDRETATERLKQALEIREIPCTARYLIPGSAAGLCLDLAIPCSSGGVGVLCAHVAPTTQPTDDWDIVVFAPEAVYNDVTSCASAISGLVQNRGGAQPQGMSVSR